MLNFKLIKGFLISMLYYLEPWTREIVPEESWNWFMVATQTKLIYGIVSKLSF